MRGNRPKIRLQRRNVAAIAKVRALVMLNRPASNQNPEKLSAMWRQARQIWLGKDRADAA